MRTEVRHSPSFAVARLHMDPGEAVQAESGAMALMSFGIEVSAQMQGGLMKSLKRSALGGESLFVTTYTGHAEYPTWVDVAARLPGDITSVDLDGTWALIVTRGSWLANSSGIGMETKWGGRSMLFGGEGGFVVRLSGQGTAVLSTYGALDVMDVPAGQGFTIDTGHLVAYQEGMNVNVRKVARGWVQSAKSGEALVMDVQGPGRIWTQSRNQGELVSWLTEVLPFTRN